MEIPVSKENQMPITIQLSKAHPEKGAVLSPDVTSCVEETVAAARDYLYNAITVVGKIIPEMTEAEKSIWRGCFLADPTHENTLAAYDVIFKTWSGSSNPHTIKLADSPYVSGSGEIHLGYNDFKPKERIILQARVWKYIHEATHKFAGTQDIGVGFITMVADEASDYCYLKMADAIKKSQIAYRRPGLQAVDALKNADSYAAFVVLLDQLNKGAFRPMNAMAVS